MLKKGAFSICLVIAMFAISLTNVPNAMAREKIIVAVADFSDSSGNKIGAAATDYVTGTFIKLKYFVVLERSKIAQVMKEIAHQQSGLVDSKYETEIGKQLGAKIMVVGTVSAAGVSKQQQKCTVYDSSGNAKSVPCVAVNATATLNVRMVNVETAEVIFSDQLNGTVYQTYNSPSQPPPDATLIDQALQSAANRLFPHIQKAFPLEGTVLKKEGQWIWVDLGSDWGIAWGRGLIFYSGSGKPIKHPKTGEIVGYEREEVANDNVSEVMPTMCKVKVSKKEAERIEVGDVVIAKPQIFY